MFPSDPLPPDLSPHFAVGISAWYFLPWALGSAPGSQGGLSGSMFLSPEASRSRIRLFCLPLQWVCECVCTRTASWHCTLNAFSHSILPVNSDMLHLPVSLTIGPSCKCYRNLRFLFSTVRTHFKLASLPLKPTKSKKKKNNKLKSSINTSWFVTEVDKQWSLISNPILLVQLAKAVIYLWRINYTGYTKELCQLHITYIALY